MATFKQLQDVAHILRRDSIISTTVAGSGHPTSCLSCAEIMSALFFGVMRYDVSSSKNKDNDEFILSKGHAAPILYAALKRAGCIRHDLKTLRKFGSALEGHPVPASLPWAKVATGSLGQGASNAVGMALAAKLEGRSYRTYCLMGDSEVAEGSVFEALNLASHYDLNNLCFIVDINRLGQTGPTMFGHHIKSYEQRFKAFGCKTVVIDGHNIKDVVRALKKFSKNTTQQPFAILAKTYKGRGVGFAENKNGWHGKAFSEELAQKALEGLPDPKMPSIHIHKPRARHTGFHTRSSFVTTHYALGESIATRQAYGHALEQLDEKDDYLIAIDAEVQNSTFSQLLENQSPRKFIQSYIAEQNMIGVAAGLAAKGFNVYASTFAAFLSRAHDQIRMAALSSLDFTIVGSHAGVSIGEDGGSQMALEDLSWFRALPGSVVFYPCDGVSTEKLAGLAGKTKGITYIRTSRPKTPVLYKNSASFVLGGFAEVYRTRKKPQIVLAGAGITVHESIEAAHLLEKIGVGCCVIDCYSIKPFDHKGFLRMLQSNGKRVVIAEDHYPEGGLGETILSGLPNVTHVHLAVRNMPHSGTKDQLLKDQGIDGHSIAKHAKALLRKKR